MSIIIEKNIPLPEKVQGKRKTNKYPLKDMEVNDSFTVPNPDNLSLVQLRNQVNSICHYFNKTNNTKFSIRVVDNQIKVWRIK